MNINDQTEVQAFTRLMTNISEYYGKEISAASIKVLMLGLQKFAVLDIQRACSVHLQNPDRGQFMPKVADIVRIIDGDTQSQAGGAWVKADRALRIHGPYADVCFDDPIIHAVIADMGGWIHFCTRSDEHEYPFQQKEFERRYQGYAGKPLQFYPKLLRGIASHSNTVENQHRIEPPKLIGDHERAFLVYQNGNDGTVKPSGSVDFSRMISDMQNGKTTAQRASALLSNQGSDK